MATHITIGNTKCTGEENSRTFPQRRTSYPESCFRECSLGDISVFQFTPMATHINVGFTKCTGEGNSRTFPQRRTSSLTRLSAKCLQAILASSSTRPWPRRSTSTTPSARVRKIRAHFLKGDDTIFRPLTRFSANFHPVENSSKCLLLTRFPQSSVHFRACKHSSQLNSQSTSLLR